MKKSTPVPHDAAFRAFLTHPDTARDFIALHLPAELRALCDLSTLKLESGSFVNVAPFQGERHRFAVPIVCLPGVPLYTLQHVHPPTCKAALHRQ